jgi:hypothetical protein
VVVDEVLLSGFSHLKATLVAQRSHQLYLVVVDYINRAAFLPILIADQAAGVIEHVTVMVMMSFRMIL